MYNPKSASSDCPGASSKSSGGMTVDFMSTGFEGLYPRYFSEPRNEPDAPEGSGMFRTCEGSTGPGTVGPEAPDAWGAGAGRPLAEPAKEQKKAAAEEYRMLD